MASRARPSGIPFHVRCLRLTRPISPMTQKLRFVVPLIACHILCACGQKGPLFLPGERSELYTELPELDREALEDAFEEDEEEGTRDVPDTERPQSTDDEAEPFIDPASPAPPADDHDEIGVD